jgi:hypothetical protein
LYSEYIEKPMLKKLVISALLMSLGVYFGGFQMVLITSVVLIILQLLYSNESKKIRAYRLFKYFLLIFILVFPLLFSLFRTHLDSKRSGTDFKEGSFLPPMALNLIIPTGFDGKDGYFGSRIDESFNQHEVYVYIGVTAFIMLVVGFLYIKDNRILNITRILVLLFLILGFLEYSPFSYLVKYSPFSAFRYWGRSVVFLILGVSIISGYLISNINQIRTRISSSILPA